MKKAGKFFLIALGIILLDQAVKLIVKLNMAPGEEIPLLGNWFKIHFIENEGAAFGLTIHRIFNNFGVEMSPVTGKLILTLFSLGAVGAIAYILYRISTHRSPLPYFVAMILGGALGNIIDRTFYGLWFSSINEYEGGLFFGRVVDMFYFDIWRGYLPDWMGGGYMALWPIWNIADSAISIGIVVILIFQGRFYRMDEKAQAPASAPGEASLPQADAAAPAAAE
jgi:signal peptidase II